jgi:hypothetical protein
MVPVHAMVACEGGGIPSLILNLGISWRKMVNFTPQPLYFRYALTRWPQSSSGRFVEEKKNPRKCMQVQHKSSTFFVLVRCHPVLCAATLGLYAVKLCCFYLKRFMLR